MGGVKEVRGHIVLFDIDEPGRLQKLELWAIGRDRSGPEAHGSPVISV